MLHSIRWTPTIHSHLLEPATTSPTSNTLMHHFRVCERRQSRRIFVGLGKPRLSVMKISNQFLIFSRRHFACPHDFRVIDVRFVVHPLIEHDVVPRFVPDDNEMLSRMLLQSFQRACPSRVDPSRRAPRRDELELWRCRINRVAERWNRETRGQQNKADDGHGQHDRLS